MPEISILCPNCLDHVSVPLNGAPRFAFVNHDDGRGEMLVRSEGDVLHRCPLRELSDLVRD